MMIKRFLKMITICICIIIALALTLTVLVGFKAIKINTPTNSQYPVRGVDVSEYQGEIDWHILYEQSVQFAFIKATEGSSYTDPYFEKNWANIQDTAIVRGAYHFFSFDSSAASQAALYISTVSNVGGMLPPVVDIELYGKYKSSPPEAKMVQDELLLLVNLLEEHYGKPPIIYCTIKSFDLYIASRFNNNPIWIRDVYFTPNLSDGRAWTFWQHSDTGRLDGYQGPEKNIDLNIYNGDLSSLLSLSTV